MPDVYHLSTSPRRRDETFTTLGQLATRILELARDPRGLRLESRMISRRGEIGPAPALAVIDSESGEFVANLFVGPRPDAMIGPIRDAVRLAADFAAARPAPADDRHPAVAAFLDMVDEVRACQQGTTYAHLSGVAVEAFAMKGVGLVARVTALPSGHFNGAYLFEGPGLVGARAFGGFRPLLSREGEGCWNALFSLGRAAVAATLDPARDLFALTLSPAAIDAARRQAQPEAA